GGLWLALPRARPAAALDQVPPGGRPAERACPGPLRTAADGRGDLLQGLSNRTLTGPGAAGQPVRVVCRGDCQAVPPRRTHCGGAYPLPAPHRCRGEEDRLARCLAHRLGPAQVAGSAHPVPAAHAGRSAAPRARRLKVLSPVGLSSPHSAASSTFSGSFTVNVEPLPTRLSTRMRPWCWSMIWRQTLRPRPVPPWPCSSGSLVV